MFLDDTQHHVDDDDENEGFGTNFDPGDAQPVEDFFVGSNDVENDYGGDMGGDYGGDNHSNNGSVGPTGDGEPGRPGPFVPFDPRRMPNERDLVLAMADDDGEGGALDYFDQNFHKNWAGPEHWKLKKVIRKRGSQTILSFMKGTLTHFPLAEADPANKPNKRQKKEAVKIDFLTPPEKDIKELTKELFAKATKGAGINLPGTGPAAGKKGRKKKEKRDDHKLPDDMHFSSRQLVTLFLKPKFFVSMFCSVLD